jgi:probable F420-dependent oxidoreductase
MKFAFVLPNVMQLQALMQPWEPNVTGADQTRMAQRAEAMGYEMLAIPEHFAMPQEHVEFSGKHWLSSTHAQAYLAGATQRIIINSSATILPLQHPIVLAKALATADWMSGGRMMVTLGVGWIESEFEHLNVPFHERGRIADEYLAAMIELWTSDSPSFEGQYVSFSDIAFEPKPVQKPHLPIWIGGDADAALRRAAKYASGWMPFLTNAEEIPAKLDYIKSQPTYDGRAFDVCYGLSTELIGANHEAVDSTTGIPGMTAEQLIDRLGRLSELGVTMCSVPIPAVDGVDAYLDYCQWVIEEIKPKVP